VLEAPTEGFEGLEVGSKPRVAGVCSFSRDQWGVNVEEVRKSGIVASQEIIKRRGGVEDPLGVTDIFEEGLTVNGADETEGFS
jgi:hypothetical protein